MFELTREYHIQLYMYFGKTKYQIVDDLRQKVNCWNIFLFVSFQVVDKLIGNDPDGEDYRPNYPMKIQLYELCLLALLIPFVFIKNIKHLAPFSMLANIASLAGLGFICEYYRLSYTLLIFYFQGTIFSR